ncbi:MAG: META domain-containing protein [Anaerolineales bacterium]|nr:META domain-containing protein [Anaerolineales bacterium]
MTYNDNHPIEGTQPTLQFEDGQVTGNASCNHYSGSYQINGDMISFDALFSTEMACMEPEGVMNQERIYLDLLMSADRSELSASEDVLTIFAGSHQILTFEVKKDDPVVSTPTLEQPTITPTDIVVEPTLTPTFTPPIGFKEYRDSVAGVSIFIPESWIVTGVIEGQYAIFESYPEDKYVGGGMREPEDTKCDLNIQPVGTTAGELIQKWESNERTTIVSDEEIVLQSGLFGQRFIIENMGRSMTLVTEINNRAVVLTCFGSPEPFDEIASTLSGFEVDPSPIHDSEEGFRQYQDFETGVTIDMPGNWIVTGIVPGQRATLQSYPENKYVGGEALQSGDTKCDLFIRPDISLEDFIHQMKSNDTLTIISEAVIVLNSGQPGTRIELESMGRTISIVTEINERVVLLACFGDFDLVDEIAVTLKASE